MNDGKLTIDLSGVGNDIPTKLGKSRPTLTTRHLHFCGQVTGVIQHSRTTSILFS